MRIKIHGGMARGGEPALCVSCRYATIARGARASDEIVHCSRFDREIRFPVTTCTRYLHQRHPTLYDMEDIAWILRTDANRGRVGFIRAKDLGRHERHVLDDEMVSRAADQGTASDGRDWTSEE
jgi:hypothetical protein